MHYTLDQQPMYLCNYVPTIVGDQGSASQSVPRSFVRSLVARQRPPLSVTAIEYGEETRERESSTTTAADE